MQWSARGWTTTSITTAKHLHHHHNHGMFFSFFSNFLLNTFFIPFVFFSDVRCTSVDSMMSLNLSIFDNVNDDMSPLNAAVIDEMLQKAQSHPKAIIRKRIIGSDVATLDWHSDVAAKKKWLNDIVIEEFLDLIVKRSHADPSLPRVYAMNTDFLTNLKKMGTKA